MSGKAKDLFESGDDVGSLFDAGEDVTPLRQDWGDAANNGASVQQEPPGPESIAPEPYGPPENPNRIGLPTALVHQYLQGFWKQGGDEGVGAWTAALQPAGNGAAWKTPDGGVRFLNTRGDVYRAGRDSERDTLREAEAQHPIPSMVANMVGDISSDAILRGLGVPVTSQPYQVASGAIAGLLNSDADLTQPTPESIMQAGEETALGGAAAYAIPIVGRYAGRQIGPYVSRAAEKVGDWWGNSRAANWLEDFANERALKAATGQNKKAINAMVEKELIGLDSGTVDAIGEDLRKTGVVTAGASTRDIMERAAERRGQAGEAIDRALTELDSSLPEGATFGMGAAEMGNARPRGLRLSGEDLADRIAAAMPSGPTHGEALVSERIAKDLDNLRALGPDVSLHDMERFRRGLDTSIDWARTNAPPAMKALRRMRTMINEAVEAKAAEAAAASGSNADKMYLASKRVYGSMKTAEDAARNQVASQISNRLVSPSDYGTLMSGGLLGSMLSNGDSLERGMTAAVVGGLFGAGNHLARTRGNQVASAAAGAMADSNWLQSVATTQPEVFGKWAQYLSAAAARSPEALGQLHNTLSETDPEYQQRMRLLGGQEQ